MNLYRFCAIFLVVLFLGQQITAFPLVWPHPQQITINSSAPAFKISPCNVRYIISSPLLAQIQRIIDHYLDSVFQCQTKNPSNSTLNIVIAGKTINLPLNTSQQAYSLFIRENGKWELNAAEYTGFLRGFETFSQLFEKNSDNSYFIQGIPIGIDDKPEFKWRGIMIDSSRHFLPLPSIKKSIDGLFYNKMNILHWHIIDEDSFPFQIPAVPELTKYGKFSGTYSNGEIKEVIEYAKIRGIRVVVEIDTPAHTESWGRSEKYKDIVVKCNNAYEGQFDPTLNLTYDVVKQVMAHTNAVFDDPYVHFGGDEVEESCWDRKPSIKQWMKANNISTYRDLSIDYHKKQKAIWRNISSTKKVIYWTNEQIDLPLQSDDVIQWWGLAKNLNRIVNRTNEVILSNYDQTYLDLGFGGRSGGTYGTYINWRDLYKFAPKYTGVNVIGGQVCMWGQLSNGFTNQQKIWVRASVLSERLWNSEIVLSTKLADIAARLVAQSTRMRERGIKTSPVSVGLCEKNIAVCF